MMYLLVPKLRAGAIISLITVMQFCTSPAFAQNVDLYWSPAGDGAHNLGGNGTWDQNTVNWTSDNLDSTANRASWGVTGSTQNAYFDASVNAAYSVLLDNAGQAMPVNSIHILSDNVSLTALTDKDTLQIADNGQTSTLVIDGQNSLIGVGFTGTGKLSISGTGSLDLEGTSDYTGSTIVSLPMLTLSGSGALKNTTAVTIVEGTEIKLETGLDDRINDLASVNVSGKLTIENNEQVERLSGAKLNAEISIADGTTFTTKSDTDSTYVGKFSGAGEFTKKGAGILILNGEEQTAHTGNINLWGGVISIATDKSIGTGTINMQGGTLRLGGDSTANIDNGIFLQNYETDKGASATSFVDVLESAQISTGITGEGKAVFGKAGVGTLSLTADNTYLGNTEVQAGVLLLSGAGKLSKTSSILIGENGELQLAASNTPVDRINDASDLIVDGKLTLAHSETVKNLSGQNKGNISLSQGTVLTVSQNNSKVYAGSTSGAGNITKEGIGTLTLTGDAAHSGTTNLTEGKITLSSGGALSKTSLISINADGILDLQAGNVDRINNAAAVEVNGKLYVNENENVGSLSGTNTAALISIAKDKSLSTDAVVDASFAGKITGAGGFIKTGDKTLTLTNTNDYQGSTSLLNGKLILGGAGSIAKSTSVTVEERSTLTLEAHNQEVDRILDSASVTLKGNLELNADEAVGTLSGDNVDAVLLFNQDVRFSTKHDSTDTVTYAGKIESAANVGGTFVKTGAGQLSLTGDNSKFTGEFRIEEGSITANNLNSLGSASVKLDNGSLNLGGTGLTYLNDIEIVDNVDPEVVNTGILNLLGENTLSGDLSGSEMTQLSITGDKLTYVGTSTMAGSLTITNSMLILGNENEAAGSFNSISSLTSQANSELHIAAGNDDRIADKARLTVDGKMVVRNEEVIGGLDGSENGLVTIEDTASLTVNEDGEYDYGGTISGLGRFKVMGQAKQTLTGMSDYSGSTTVGGSGQLTISGDDGQLTSTESVLVESSATLVLDAGNDDRLGANTLLTVNGTMNVNNNETVSSLGGLGEVNVADQSEFTLDSDNATDIEFGGDITGLGSFAKKGQAKFTLTRSNSYKGSTNIKFGAMVLDHNGALTNSQSISVLDGGSLTLETGINNRLFDAAVLKIDGELFVNNSETAGGLTGTGEVFISKDNILTLDLKDENLFSGDISSEGGLTVKGTGSLELTGVNTFSGNLFINGGTVLVENESHLGSNDLVLFDGGNLHITTSSEVTKNFSLREMGGALFNPANTTVTYSGELSGSGKISKEGEGTMILSGENTHTGGTRLGQGIVQIDSGANLGTGKLIFEGGRLNTVKTLTLNGAVEVLKESTIDVLKDTTTTVNSAVSGSGNLTKIGGGTLQFDGNKSGGTGTLSVNEGKLKLSNNGRWAGDVALAKGSSLDVVTGNSNIQGQLTSQGNITVGSNAVLTVNDGTHITNGSITIGSQSRVVSDMILDNATQFYAGGMTVGKITTAGSVNINSAEYTHVGDFNLNSGATFNQYTIGVNNFSKVNIEGKLNIQSNVNWNLILRDETDITVGTPLQLVKATSINGLDNLKLSDGSSLREGTLSVKDNILYITYSSNSEAVDDYANSEFVEKVPVKYRSDPNIASAVLALANTKTASTLSKIEDIGISSKAKLMLAETSSDDFVNMVESIIPSDSGVVVNSLEMISDTVAQTVYAHMATAYGSRRLLMTPAAYASDANLHSEAIQAIKSLKKQRGETTNLVTAYDSTSPASGTQIPYYANEISVAEVDEIGVTSEIVEQRLYANNRNKPYRVWLKGMASETEVADYQDGNSYINGYQMKQFGAIFAGDYSLNNNLVAGALATISIADSNDKGKQINSNLDATLVGGGAYVSYVSPFFEISTLGVAQYVSVKTSRDIQAMNDRLEGAWDGYQVKISGQGKVNILNYKQSTIGLVGGIGLSILRRPEFSERGVNFYIEMDDSQRVDGNALVGVDYHQFFILKNGTMVAPFVQTTLNYGTSLSALNYERYRFGTNGADAILVEGKNDQISGTVKAGINAQITSDIGMNFSADYSQSDIRRTISGEVVLNYRF